MLEEISYVLRFETFGDGDIVIRDQKCVKVMILVSGCLAIKLKHFEEDIVLEILSTPGTVIGATFILVSGSFFFTAVA